MTRKNIYYIWALRARLEFKKVPKDRCIENNHRDCHYTSTLSVCCCLIGIL